MYFVIVGQVERCRSQLYGGRDMTLASPQATSSWRESCSRILYKDKRALSEVFTMAQMSLSTWNVFQKFNDLYESGKLKEQKFILCDVTRGTLAVKQWHLKPLVSLRDETKEFLLNKLISGEILLKNLKQEATDKKTLIAVQNAIMSFFKIENWKEAITRFGTMVDSDKLLRFTGNFESTHAFQTYLKRLAERETQERELQTDDHEQEFRSSNGKNIGHVLFHPIHVVSAQVEFFKNNFSGVCLTTAVIGFDSNSISQTDTLEEDCQAVVDLASRLNFTKLSAFNCVIMSPVSVAHSVHLAFSRKGACMVQRGFVYHKKESNSAQGVKLNEVVTAFTVGHWSASRTVESCYVNYRSPPKLGDEYPTAFYDNVIKFFSKDGDTVMEVGYGTNAGNSFLAAVENGRRAILVRSARDTRHKSGLLSKISGCLTESNARTSANDNS